VLLRDLGRRLIGLAVSLLVASLLIFLATNALPGSIANVVLGLVVVMMNASKP